VSQILNVEGARSTSVPTAARQTEVLLEAACWSCDDSCHKLVTWANRLHRHFQWLCTRCEVSWSGPGVVAGLATATDDH
jgi:hypothetical protein